MSEIDAVDGSPPTIAGYAGAENRRRALERVTTIGLDIAKSVFQVHGVDATGEVMERRRLMRARLVAFIAKLARCLIGIEARAISHHRARELRKLRHDVRLMPPS
jgi:transposase